MLLGLFPAGEWRTASKHPRTELQARAAFPKARALGPLELLSKMASHTTTDRVRSLQAEIEQIWEENRQYLAAGHHSHVERAFHQRREKRLVEILQELSLLTKKNL